MIKKIFRFFGVLIKKIFFSLVVLIILIFMISSALFYLSFPFIEKKTKERFGEDFLYVHDISEGKYGHFRPEYACVKSFEEIPKWPLFDRVILFNLGLTDWGNARRYMSKGAFLIPLHFGVVDKNEDFYYWSYWNWDYIEAKILKRRSRKTGEIVWFDGTGTALGRIGARILERLDECRSAMGEEANAEGGVE